MEVTMKIQTIKPNPGPQEQFLKCTSDISIFGGAAGGGKTFALLLECVRYLHVRDFNAVIFRKSLTQVKNEGGLWHTSHEIFPYVGGIPRESDLSWQFPSGARVKFASMNNENARQHWDGSQISLIGFDELIHFSKSQFFYMLSRNRSICGVTQRIRATTNPSAGSWLKDFLQWWIDEDTGYPIPERSGVIRWFYNINDSFQWYDSKQHAMQEHPDLAAAFEPLSVTFIPSKLQDNPILMKMNPRYTASLQGLSVLERERLLFGNWNLVNDGGTMFHQNWWKFMATQPDEERIIVRYWDKAATTGAGCETAGVKMSKTKDGRYIVEDVVHGRWSTFEREQKIRQTAEQDGKGVEIVIEKEPGSAGEDSAFYTIKNLAGFNVKAERPTGDKVERAGPFSSQVQAGTVYLVKSPWNKEYINQHHNFPQTKLKDMVDASSGALNILAVRKGKWGWKADPEMFKIHWHPESGETIANAGRGDWWKELPNYHKMW